MATDESSRTTCDPWVPVEFSIRAPVRTVTRTRQRGAQVAKERPCWDVRFVVDGRRYFRRFDRAGDADAFVGHLRRGESLRWPFDPVTRRCLDPASATETASEHQQETEVSSEAIETVFSWTDRYWTRKWPTLEPRGRSELARYLNRARRFLVDVEPDGAVADDVDRFLSGASLTTVEAAPDPSARRGASWLEAHSLAMVGVGRRELEALIDRHSRHYRDPTRRVSAASIRRMVADLRPCWDRAVVEEIIPANPWDAVDLGLRAFGGGKRSTGTTLGADVDVVLDPSQVWALAKACVEHGTWGATVRGFVLAMGFCGLRPNEAAGLLVGDLELPSHGPGWLIVRRSQRRVPRRFLDTEEDPTWGPLKGRELADERRVPVPTDVVAALRTHLADHRAGAGPHDLVFERRGRPFNLAGFHLDVWAPGREALYPLSDGLAPDSPLQPKLTRLRRHDLRHSACSMWLRAGVDVTVCQKWSGHKRLSVFLDVYQGVMPGREAEGVKSLESLLSPSRRSQHSG